MMNLEVRRLTKRGERKYHPHTAPWRLPTGHGQKKKYIYKKEDIVSGNVRYIYKKEDIVSGNVRSHKSKGLSSDM